MMHEFLKELVGNGFYASDGEGSYCWYCGVAGEDSDEWKAVQAHNGKVMEGFNPDEGVEAWKKRTEDFIHLPEGAPMDVYKHAETCLWLRVKRFFE